MMGSRAPATSPLLAASVEKVMDKFGFEQQLLIEEETEEEEEDKMDKDALVQSDDEVNVESNDSNMTFFFSRKIKQMVQKCIYIHPLSMFSFIAL